MVAQRGADEGIAEAMARRSATRWCCSGRCARAGVEIRLHRTVLYNSIYIADDQALVNCHIYGVPAARAPCCTCARWQAARSLAT